MNSTLPLARTGKVLLTGLFLSTALMFSMTSCKKDSTSSVSSADSVTEADAADAVTSAVTPATAGMVSQTETAVVIVNDGNLACGTESDSTITGANLSGAAVTYNYSLNWSSLMSCTNSIPSSYGFNFTGKFSYDAPRISSADSSTGSFTLSGIQPGVSAYTFNSNYVREGSEVSKVREMRSFNSKISITSTNIIVDKATEKITSGTASVSISGASSSGKSFSFSGTITFNGDETATVVLASGTSYSITW